MPRSRSLVAAVALTSVLALGTVATACGSDSNTASTTTTAAPSSSGTAPKSFSVSTPQGDVSLSLDGKLPPSWPSSFPVPSGAEPAGSGSLAKSESGVQIAVFSTSQSGADAFSFYSQNSSLSPSNVKSTGVGNAFVGTLTLGGSWDGSVTVAGSGGTTYIVVVLTGSSGAGSSGGSGTTVPGTSGGSGTTMAGSVSS